MANVARAERGLRDAADREYTAATGELACEREACFDLCAGRRTIRCRCAGVRRHDIPEQDSVLERQLLENAVHDRRSGFCGPGSGELALGRERDAGEARTVVAGGFADQEQRRVGAGFEVALQARCETIVGVLVVRRADLCGSETVYQCSQRTTSSRTRRLCVIRLEDRLAFGSGLPFPNVTPATTWMSSGMRRRSLNCCIAGTVTP